MKQGTCGELFGYGYLPLPLTPAKTTTAGPNIPTGDQSWTLFLNTKNFKGPVAFFTPYFWSRGAVDQPRLAGQLLDSRPSNPNRALQMETQYVPSVQATDAIGRVYARIAPTAFPRGTNDESVVVHRITSYTRTALWDSVKSWFEGGPPSSGAIDARQSVVHKFPGGGGATWEIYMYLPSTPKGQKPPVMWKSFATPTAGDANTFGYRWNFEHVRKDGLEGRRAGHLAGILPPGNQHGEKSGVGSGAGRGRSGGNGPDHIPVQAPAREGSRAVRDARRSAKQLEEARPRRRPVQSAPR